MPAVFAKAAGIFLLMWGGVLFAAAQTDTSCITGIQRHVVQGKSMEGWISNGDSADLWMNYYVCNAPQREEFVVFRLGGPDTWLIKRIVGIAGDTWKLDSLENGQFQLRVNDSLVLDADEQPYVFNKNRKNMLQLYINAYHGIIPENSLVVLGADANTRDSSVFGLIGMDSLVGRAFPLKQ